MRKWGCLNFQKTKCTYLYHREFQRFTDSLCMNKLALVKSVSKQYLLMQKSMRRNKKLMSSGKLLLVLIIFFSVLAVYAVNITSASTKGYFHRQETRVQDDLVFERSIVDLEMLQLEKKLLDNVWWINGSWYGSTDRMEIVYTYDSELVLNE